MAEPSAEKTVGSEEALRLAQEALDQLEAATDPTERQKLIEQVKSWADVVKAADESSPWLFYLYGRLNAVTGRRSDARDQLRKFIETPEGRNEWSAYKALGDLFVDEFARLARSNYGRAAELKPNEPAILFGLSLCEFKLADYEKAHKLAQEAVVADGRKTARYLTQLATVLMAQKRWLSAETQALEALKLNEETLQRQTGKLDALQAVEARWRLLVEIAQGRVRDLPKDADGYVRLSEYMKQRAGIVSQLTHHDRAGVLALGIQNTAPDAPVALRLAYAEALAEAARNEDAITELNEILTIDPNHAAASQWLNRLQPPQEKPEAP